MTHQQQPVTRNPLDQLREAHGVFLEVLSNVRPEQMTLSTPDDEWDVRALIKHVVERRIMPDLPSGTATFLFIDIEGSTRLWDRDRRAMAVAGSPA